MFMDTIAKANELKGLTMKKLPPVVNTDNIGSISKRTFKNSELIPLLIDALESLGCDTYTFRSIKLTATDSWTHPFHKVDLDSYWVSDVAEIDCEELRSLLAEHTPDGAHFDFWTVKA